jgi:hypothetical protein
MYDDDDDDDDDDESLSSLRNIDANSTFSLLLVAQTAVTFLPTVRRPL